MPQQYQPTCLQQRAPASYEIVDRRGKRVPSTIAGFRLKPDAEYELNVWTQDGTGAGWEIQPGRARSFVRWEFGGGPSRTGHTQPFRTTGMGRSRLWILSSPVDEIALRLHFHDGRQPYDLRIPVQLANRYLYAPAALLALGSVLPSYRYFKLSLESAALIALAILALFTVVCYVLDLWRSYRRARRVIRDFDEQLARSATQGLQASSPGS